MHSSEVTLENIGPVKGLLGGRARARAESTHHGTLIVGQGMPVLVVFASKAFDVVLTREDGAFLGSLRLMRKHVGLEVLEGLPAIGMRTSLLLLRLVAVVCILV
jgi:hypothetical protein